MDYKVKELPPILNMSRNDVYEEIKRGNLKAYRVGKRGLRITEKALEEYRTKPLVPYVRQPAASSIRKNKKSDSPPPKYVPGMKWV